MNKKIQSALISVFYKDGLEPVVKTLHNLGITIYSTGGTQARVALGSDWCVRPTRELRERLSELVGLDGFRFVYEGPRQ